MRQTLRFLAAAGCFLSISLGLSSPAWAVKYNELRYVQSTRADLDGNGSPENIALTHKDDRGRFTLVIDNARIQGELSSEVNGLAVVDVDRSDRFKEVIVYTEGPSSDDDSILYAYDGNSIREMARDLKWFDIPGTGIVRDAHWMEFWTLESKYVHDASRRVLRYVPQDLYYVGKTARVTGTFTLSVSRTNRTQVAIPRIGSQIMILAFGAPNAQPPHRGMADGWYLIKTETGLMGWATLKSFVSKVDGLPFAD